MMLSSYLSPSRHGVYYFRWPIPPSQEGKRATVRISLRTRCPDRAGDLARYLASCGRILGDNSALAGLRQSEIRDKVQAYFKAQLDQYLDWLDRRGLSQNPALLDRDTPRLATRANRRTEDAPGVCIHATFRGTAEPRRNPPPL